MVLASQLKTESAELKDTIISLFEAKTAEFSKQITQKLEEFVDTKIKQFYIPVDTELFDSIVNVAYTDRHSGRSIPGPEFIGKRCFVVEFDTRWVCVTETEILRYTKPVPTDGNVCLSVTLHNIRDVAVLRTMKHLQLFHNGKGFQLYEEQPTYFMPNYAFETTCKLLEVCIEEHVTKKEYYESLEQKLKDMEEREHRLKCEREKLNEDTQALLIVKQQIEAKAAELQREREQFNAVLEHI